MGATAGYGRGTVTPWRHHVIACAILSCSAVAQTPPAVAQHSDVPQSVAFVHANIVDIAEGKLLPDRTIVIRGDWIESVEKSSETSGPPTARRIDARGKFAIPGLWDMHVHLSYAKESALPLLLANGVTGVRDMGSS